MSILLVPGIGDYYFGVPTAGFNLNIELSRRALKVTPNRTYENKLEKKEKRFKQTKDVVSAFNAETKASTSKNSSEDALSEDLTDVFVPKQLREYGKRVEEDVNTIFKIIKSGQAPCLQFDYLVRVSINYEPTPSLLGEEKWVCLEVTNSDWEKALVWVSEARDMAKEKGVWFLKQAVFINPEELPLEKELDAIDAFGKAGAFVRYYGNGVSYEQALEKLNEEVKEVIDEEE